MKAMDVAMNAILRTTANSSRFAPRLLAQVMDSAWNPCHDAQAVCRVYRYGQKRKCFVYRLVASGTMEQKIYDRQIHKTMLSSHVVDTENLERRFSAAELAQLFKYSPAKPSEGPLKDPSGGTDPAMAALCAGLWPGLTAIPFEHTSLLLATADPAKQLSTADKERALRHERLYDHTTDQLHQTPRPALWHQPAPANLNTFGIQQSHMTRPLQPDHGRWRECWDRTRRRFYWWLTGTNPPFVTWNQYPWLVYNDDGSKRLQNPVANPIFQSAQIFQQPAKLLATTSATRIGGAAGGRTLVEISDYDSAGSRQRPLAARTGRPVVLTPSVPALPLASMSGVANYAAIHAGGVGASVSMQRHNATRQAFFPFAADQANPSVLEVPSLAVPSSIAADPQTVDNAAAASAIVL